MLNYSPFCLMHTMCDIKKWTSCIKTKTILKKKIIPRMSKKSSTINRKAESDLEFFK